MAWTSGLIAQNGNTSVSYGAVAFPGMGIFDVVSIGPEAGSSAANRIRIFTHEIGAGPTHVVGVEVIGPAAVSFRIRGGLPA